MCVGLRELKVAMQAYSTAFDAARLSCGDAAEVVKEAAAIEHMAATVKSLAAARAAEERSWKHRGYRSAEEELARRTGSSVNAARDALTLGRRLAEQPQVADAARQGVISPTQASTIADAVEADPTAAGGLLGAATSGGSLAELKAQAADVKAKAVDLETRRRHIDRRRYLRQWTNPDGEWHLHAMGTPEDGAQIMAHLEPLAATNRKRAHIEGRYESREAHRFDALVLAAVEANSDDPDAGDVQGPQNAGGPAQDKPGQDEPGQHREGPGHLRDVAGTAHSPDATSGPGDLPANPSQPARSRARRSDKRYRRGAPVKLLIRVDLDTLLRGFPVDGEVCELVGYGPVSVTALHKLLQDGDPFVAAILAKGRQLVGVAHLGRKPTAHQRSFLEWLYPTCAAQGCPAVAQHLQIDHRHDWADTHITLIDWLDGLCPHDHRKKTQYGWSLIDGIGKRPFVPPTDPRHPKYYPPSGSQP